MLRFALVVDEDNTKREKEDRHQRENASLGMKYMFFSPTRIFYPYEKNIVKVSVYPYITLYL